MFNSTPVLNIDKSQKSLETWKKLKPLSIEEIMKHSETDLDFENSNTEIKQLRNEERSKAGQFKKGTTKLEGIGRRITRTNYIHEGQFHMDQMHGYSRLFFEDGSYYIGMFRSNKMCGKGKFVSHNGSIKEGIFKENQFVGPEISIENDNSGS